MKTFLIIIIALLGCCQAEGSIHYAILSGSGIQLQNGDSVKISVNAYSAPSGSPITGSTIYQTQIADHAFKFKIPVNHEILHAEILFRGKVLGRNPELPLLLNYLIESGDSVVMNIVQSKFRFSGVGAAKFQTIYELFKISNKDPGQTFQNKYSVADYLSKSDQTNVQRMRFLISRRSSMSDLSYNMLKSAILAEINDAPLEAFHRLSTDSLKQIGVAEYLHYHRDLPGELVSGKEFNPDSQPLYAGAYSSSLYKIYMADSCYALKRPFVFEQCYQYIKHHYSGVLRERAITDLFCFGKRGSYDMGASLTDALAFVKTEVLVHILQIVQETGLRGTKAIDFEMPDSTGLMHHLSDYRGKVVLIDFWFSGCGPCRELAPALENVERQFQGKPVVFISVNADKRKEFWLKNLRTGIYTSDKTIDLFTSGLELQHPFALHYSVQGCPTLLLFDKNQNLMQNPVRPSVDQGRDLSHLINVALQ